jgi:cytochrome P450
LPYLVAGLGFFARKTLRARQKLFNAFRIYLGNDFDDAAEVMKRRIEVLSNYGVSADDITLMQVSFNLALFSNTAPTAFWTFFNIFSRPELLRELRAELEDCVISSGEANGETPNFELDIDTVKTRCPLLLSVFQETQRTRTIHAYIRKVLEDTTFDGYHLQKGNYLQVPIMPIHYNTDIWGANAEDFDARRFVEANGTIKPSALPPNSFMPWGSAPHLCPARQFASTEILIMAALLLLRLEIEPVGDNWVVPKPNYGELVTLLSPKADIDVVIRRREGWVGNWTFKYGESKLKVPLSSG